MSDRKTEKLPPVNENTKYAVLMETSGEECESWYYFIRHDGNEEALNNLNEQLNQVSEWYIIDGYSTFDLVLDPLVSHQTAKEMINLDLNHTSFHRKFDGVMKKVNLKFKSTDKDSRKIKRAFKVLGYGRIENFVEDEDVTLTSDDLEEDEDTSSSTDSNESASTTEEEDGAKKMSKKGIPEALLNCNLPRNVRAKQHRRKKK